jgi:UDP-glucose 4-epimerase
LNNDSAPACAFEGRDVLITGGLGFIGSNLARTLVELGARVTVVDSLVPSAGGNRFNLAGIENRVDVHVADMRDKRLMQELVAGRQYLFNLGGLSSHMDSMSDPIADLDANCTAHLSVLEACRAGNPGISIVFASTRQIYGRITKTPVDESCPLQPIDVNGIHKVAAESYHLLYGRVYDIPVRSLRLTNTIGPRMRIKDERQTFVGVWIRRLLEGKPIEVWGGSQRRDFTFVDDAVEAMLKAAQSDACRGEALNIGGDRAISLVDLARLMIEIHGSGEYVVRPFPVERQRIDIGDYLADSTKAGELLGWRPATPLEDGLRRTMSYFREHLPRYV